MQSQLGVITDTITQLAVTNLFSLARLDLASFSVKFNTELIPRLRKPASSSKKWQNVTKKMHAVKRMSSHKIRSAPALATVKDEDGPGDGPKPAAAAAANKNVKKKSQQPSRSVEDEDDVVAPLRQLSYVNPLYGEGGVGTVHEGNADAEEAGYLDVNQHPSDSPRATDVEHTAPPPFYAAPTYGHAKPTGNMMEFGFEI